MNDETEAIRWESATRYYTAVLHRDLLDDWVLTIARGGRKNRLGALDRKRTRRGYVRLTV